MNTTYTLLLISAILIIAVLAGYAWHLLRRVKKMEQQQQKEAAEAELNIKKRQQELLHDIRFISRSVIDEQCEVTEGVLRLHYLISVLDPDVWAADELTVIRKHHSATSAMPILDAYKALSRKEQFALDKERLALEEAHQASIKQELRWLLSHGFNNVTLIQ